MATIQLFDIIHHTGRFIPIVYASSSAVYGENGHVPLKEDEPNNILTAYAADKLGCELH